MNPQIVELTDALVNTPRKSESDIRTAMDLAYRQGKLDGAIEVLDKQLSTKPAKSEAAA